VTTSVLYLHEHAVVSGGEISLLALWRGLDRARYRPVWLGPAEGPLVDRARALDVAIAPARFPRFRELAAPSAWRMLADLARAGTRAGARIVHGNGPHTNVAAAWVGRRLGIPVVWHGRTLPRPGEHDVERWLARLPDRIVCNSAAVARRFSRAMARTVVVPNGVALDEFAPGAGGGAFRRRAGVAPGEVAIGIVGNLSAIKRHEVFLRAAARCVADAVPARFLVVGAEVFRDNRGRTAIVRDEAHRLGLGERVRFLPWQTDMPAVMDGLDVLVSTCDVEACSRAVIEALACGTPVVAVAAGGHPELVDDGRTGLLVPAGDDAALAAALVRLVRDPALRMAMSGAARRDAVARFDVRCQVAAIERVYDALASGAC
jgi:glycosyltransferase involved in cell wall biosynthesis